MTINSKKDNLRTLSVKKVADMWGVQTNYVYKVIRGEREHEGIFTTYMEMLEGHNELVEKVKELVPFETKKAI